MPDPQRVLNTILSAAEGFRGTAGRVGTVIHIGSDASDVIVAGDLHGNLSNFRSLLAQAALDQHPGRHLVLQELVHGTARYSNGGCRSHQLVDVVCALKCQYPDRVHLMLGNHELSELENRVIVKDGQRQNELFRRGIETAYGSFAPRIHDAYLQLFRSLPLAVRNPYGVFMCHSIPDGSKLSAGFDCGIFRAETLAELPGKRGSDLYSLVWGRDTSEQTARQFAGMVDASWLITGHVPCSQGFDLPNPIQLILDCAARPAAYCVFRNEGLDFGQLRAGIRLVR